MSDILIGFGKAIAIIRNKKNLTQEKLAELANLDRTYIGRVERGKRNISLKNIEKIAKALNISITVVEKQK